jgi:hypothetical protein
MLWTPDRVAAPGTDQPVDDASRGPARGHTAPVSIEMPVERVRALGRSLEAAAGTADDARTRLVDEGDVDGPLRTPVELFLDRHRTLATALAGELRWLGGTVAGIADAWAQLDATLLLPAPGGEPGR